MTGFDLGQLIHITDARAPDLSEIEMWRVTGVEGLYPTKIAAEKAARVYFPNEPINLRYARIYFVRYERST